MEFYNRTHFEEAAEAVRACLDGRQPRVGIVLGSGLGDFAESVENAVVIPYTDIPHWPISTVIGHSGQLHIGELSGQQVMVMRGRSHFYEGYPMSQVTLPIRVMQLLGLRLVILTNAAGGVNKNFSPGEVMMLTDHLNLLGMTGFNPLIGPNDDSLGTRFPDMSKVYDRELREIAQDVASQHDVPMHQGVYCCLSGPTFETPADIRFLRKIGADAVGMSTVPEAIVARHGGMKALAFSGISNVAIDEIDTDLETTHEEVLEAGQLVVPRLVTVLRGVLERLPESL